MDNSYLYYLGLDLGQARDYSALAIIEQQLYVGEAWANEVLLQQDYQKGLSAGWISPAAVTKFAELRHEEVRQALSPRPATGGRAEKGLGHRDGAVLYARRRDYRMPLS